MKRKLIRATYSSVRNSNTLYRPNYKLYNEIWNMRLDDPDHFPSVPHGHSLSNRYKLNVWNGEVFNRQTGKKVGKVPKKELRRLHQDDDFLDFARITIKTHHEIFPEHSFFIPEWVFERKLNEKKTNTRRQTESFTISLKAIIVKS